MSLTNGTISLRKMEPSDLDFLYKWENDSNNWLVSNTISPFSKFTLQQYIATANDDVFVNKQLRLIIQSENEVVGCVDLFDIDFINKKAGIGILIDSATRDKGIATQVLSILTQYSFSVLQLHQVYCNILTDNIVSLKLFKNAGFELVGTKKDWVLDNGTWKDEQLFQKIKND